MTVFLQFHDMTLILNYPNQTHSLLGDAVDGTNGEERHESEDAAVSAYATAAVTENGAAYSSIPDGNQKKDSNHLLIM